MLWSLLASAYVIYLYRKLNAERTDAAAAAAPNPMSEVEAEFMKLSRRLDHLESVQIRQIRRPER